MLEGVEPEGAANIMKNMGTELNVASLHQASWITKAIHWGKAHYRALSSVSLTVLLTSALVLGGCAIIPGNDVYDMRRSGETSVKLPVATAEGTVPANVTVRTIDAELIIEKEKELGSAPERPYVPPVHQDYRLAAGDIITIIVWDHPELTIPAGEFRSAEQAGTVVAEDGTIFFPFAGVIKVEGLTLRQVRKILTEKLSRTIENVQLEVRIAAFRSQRIYVVGEVIKPGIIPVTDVPLTMIEAVNQAGGFSPEADRRNITLTRAGTTSQIDLLALYEDGDTSQNVSLKHGDIVNIPDRQFNKVFVLGAVNRPGSQVMNKRRLTLVEALSDAVDIEQLIANPNQIYVLRGGDKPEIYHLASKSPDALLLADRFPLKPRDIVYVDAAGIVRWNRLISNLLPTSNLLTTTVVQ